jgi:lipopolysaccharide export system protein LptC
MARHLGTLGTVGALLMLALGTRWLLEAVSESSRPAAESAHQPDYYAKQFVVTTMDEHGEPRQRLSAHSLVHFMDDDSAELSEPRLTVLRAQAPPWQIDSDRAWVSAGGKLILMHGQVEIRRPGGASTRPLRIRTSEVRVHTDQAYAESDEAVTIETPGHRIDAVGVRAWLREPSRVELLSKVRGTHEAQQLPEHNPGRVPNPE